MRKLVLALSLYSCPSMAQQIELPAFAVEDEAVALAVSDLQPGRLVVLEVERVTAEGARAVSRNEFEVAVDGRLDPAKASPRTGYVAADPSGPFWSMTPERAGAGSLERGTLAVRALNGKTTLVAKRIPLRPLAPGVRFEDIPTFPGARLFLPDGNGRRPVLIILGGSEGGTDFGRFLGPKLAARGYAAIALPYYNSGWGGEPIAGLPRTFQDIEVGLLSEVRDWIRRRSDLDASSIGLYGVSKGGEFAMLAASKFPWLKAVVGVVPSDVVWEGWGAYDVEGTRPSFAWMGRPLPFVPYKGMTAAFEGLARGERRTLVGPHLDGRRENPQRAANARIAVEGYAGPMLVAGGDKDTTWPSGEMTRAIAERRAARGLRTVSLTFADAGHALAGTGWEPMAYGGSSAEIEANAKAQAQVWSATLEFLADVMPPRLR